MDTATDDDTTMTQTVAEKKRNRPTQEIAFTPLDLVHLAPAGGLKLVFRPFA